MSASTHASIADDASIVVRRAHHDDPHDRANVLGILREYLISIGEDESAEARYAWLYLGNPALSARTFVASDRATSEVVALTSLFPRPVWVRGRVFLGAIGGDGYVTPRYRRRGIITRLHRAALEAMADRDEPVSFMFGPPEPNNLKALLNAGAARVGDVQRFVRPLTASGFGARAASLPPAFGAPLSWLLAPRRSKLRMIELGDEPDARVDTVWAATTKSIAAQVIPVRDAVFYAWRFGSAVGAARGYVLMDGEVPVASVALEKSDGNVAILDVTAPPRWWPRAVRAVLDASRGADAVHIEVHTPARRLRAMLHALGFFPRASKPFQVQAHPNHPEHEALLRAEAWRYMWGDGDVTGVL